MEAGITRPKNSDLKILDFAAHILFWQDINHLHMDMLYIFFELLSFDFYWTWSLMMMMLLLQLLFVSWCLPPPWRWMFHVIDHILDLLLLLFFESLYFVIHIMIIYGSTFLASSRTDFVLLNFILGVENILIGYISPNSFGLPLEFYLNLLSTHSLYVFLPGLHSIIIIVINQVNLLVIRVNEFLQIFIWIILNVLEKAVWVFHGRFSSV
jgi:hypothetical protein